MRRLLIPTAALMLVLPAGCGLIAQLIQPLIEISAGTWYTVGPVRRDLPELTTMTRDLILRQGFKITRFKPREEVIETEWKVQLSPRFREGIRTKLEVNFQTDPNGLTLIQIRSHRQINDNSENPIMGDRTIWIGASIDEKQSRRMNEPAMKLKQILKLKLFGLRRD